MQFQIAALIILLLFYGCYFGKMFHQKKQGIQTDQMGKDKKGLIKFIEITLKAATFSVPVIEVISIAENTALLPFWARYLGIAIAFLGDALFICSVLTMRDSWRAGVPQTDKTELVTRGIFQISRNPAFLGFDFMYIGILLLFFNWLLLAVSAFAILMLHLQIVNVEEDFLIAAFGEEYLAYSQKVCRYLGRKKIKKQGEKL